MLHLPNQEHSLASDSHLIWACSEFSLFIKFIKSAVSPWRITEVLLTVSECTFGWPYPNYRWFNVCKSGWIFILGLNKAVQTSFATPVYYATHCSLIPTRHGCTATLYSECRTHMGCGGCLFWASDTVPNCHIPGWGWFGLWGIFFRGILFREEAMTILIYQNLQQSHTLHFGG
jgi:hypothetical protein